MIFKSLWITVLLFHGRLPPTTANHGSYLSNSILAIITTYRFLQLHSSHSSELKDAVNSKNWQFSCLTNGLRCGEVRAIYHY